MCPVHWLVFWIRGSIPRGNSARVIAPRLARLARRMSDDPRSPEADTGVVGNTRKFKKKKKISFFPSKTHIVYVHEFDIFVLTYRVTNFLPKLVRMQLLYWEKTEFPIFDFPIFGYCWNRARRSAQCNGIS